MAVQFDQGWDCDVERALARLGGPEALAFVDAYFDGVEAQIVAEGTARAARGGKGSPKASPARAHHHQTGNLLAIDRTDEPPEEEEDVDDADVFGDSPVCAPEREPYAPRVRLRGYALAGARASATTPTLVCVHGAGYSADTWLRLAGSVAESDLRLIALDLRAHGESGGAPSELSLRNLVKDVLVWLCDAQERLGPLGPLIFVGHSLGGAIVTHLCNVIPVDVERQPKRPGGLPLDGSAPLGKTTFIVALCMVLEISEALGLEALPHMEAVLRARPAAFADFARAFRWACESSHAPRDRAGALSLLSQLRPASSPLARTPSLSDHASEDEAATAVYSATYSSAEERESAMKILTPELRASDVVRASTVAATQGEATTVADPASTQPGTTTYLYNNLTFLNVDLSVPLAWRVDLLQTVQHWRWWFAGLARAFLRVRGHPLLALAREADLGALLTRARMQGRFQLALVPRAGHAIQQDNHGALWRIVQHARDHYKFE